MTITTADTIEIDTKPVPAPAVSPWRYLPWALFIATAIPLAVTFLPRPVEPVAPSPPPEPSVFVGEQSGAGALRILQDANGRVTGAVLVVDGDEAWCRLLVDGTVVVEEHGSPAVCVWARR